MSSGCSHDAVFYGNINLMDDGAMLGAIDVWKCRRCQRLFVDEKRFVEEKPPTKVGLEDAGEGAKWGVLLCSANDQIRWLLLSVKPEMSLIHDCLSAKPAEVKVGNDWSAVSDDWKTVHRILLVEDHINKAVEVGEILKT